MTFRKCRFAYVKKIKTTFLNLERGCSRLVCSSHHEYENQQVSLTFCFLKVSYWKKVVIESYTYSSGYFLHCKVDKYFTKVSFCIF